MKQFRPKLTDETLKGSNLKLKIFYFMLFSATKAKSFVHLYVYIEFFDEKML
jgi:hypothetical protein